ncbi:hypothetical protein E0494_09430 [Marinilabiliaceae bacterium JC040]|nr:hypothetical protein [Marinilabiliaceae bacterium JC040]
MKKLLLLSIALILLAFSQETKAQFSVGAGTCYATDISSLGLSANVSYDINEDFFATSDFTYFFEKDLVSWSAFDVNANYAFLKLDKIGSIYGIGGINITSVKIDIPKVAFGGALAGGGSVSESNFGFNIGAGLKIDLTDKILLAPEMSYTISSGSYFRLGVRLMYKL